MPMSPVKTASALPSTGFLSPRDNYNGNRSYDIFHHRQINDAFSVIWNHTFSPTLLNELRANAAGWRWNEVTDNSQSPVGFPSDGITQIGSINPESFGPNVGSILNQWTYSYKDVATKIIGRHTIKFGGEATRLFYLNECVGCGVPNYNFFNMWDFLNDAPHTEGYTTFNPNTGLADDISPGRPREYSRLLCSGRLETPPKFDRQSRSALVLFWPAL